MRVPDVQLPPSETQAPDATRLVKACLILGIVSLVLAIFLFGFIAGIPALVCGYRARKRMANGGRGSRARVRIGVVLGLVSSIFSVVVITLLLISEFGTQSPRLNYGPTRTAVPQLVGLADPANVASLVEGRDFFGNPTNGIRALAAQKCPLAVTVNGGPVPHSWPVGPDQPDPTKAQSITAQSPRAGTGVPCASTVDITVPGAGSDAPMR